MPERLADFVLLRHLGTRTEWDLFGMEIRVVRSGGLGCSFVLRIVSHDRRTRGR